MHNVVALCKASLGRKVVLYADDIHQNLMDSQRETEYETTGKCMRNETV